MRSVTTGRRVAWLAALVWATVVPGRAGGQVGDVTDIITGRITDEQGNPLSGVTVEALSLETQIMRSTRTGAGGRFTILFPDGGGQYRMTARRIGMTPFQANLVRYADEDRLVWNVQLSTQPFMLPPIEVEARLTPVRVPDRPSPGSTERSLTPDLVQGLPIEPEDLNVLATLVPGVVGVEATDSSESSFAVAGQRPDANAITLDGMTFGTGNVPQDGLRRTRIITSTYDVSRGRFSGGLIAATTRSGTNRLQASGNYSLRDDDLAFASGAETPFTSGFTMHRLSGGVGGPVLRNRLFVFGSVQVRLRTDPLAALTTASPSDLERLGIAPDSVERFVALAGQLGATGDAVFGASRSNDNVSALLRFDYLVSNSHTLTLRGDLRRTSQDPTRVSRLGLPETGGVNENAGGGVMVRLASRFGLNFINEARAYVARSRRDADPFMDIPQGRVQVASDLPDGSSGIRTLVLGGNARLPTTSRGTTVEIANELSWLPGTGRHRIKLGGLITSRASDDVRSRNQYGTFTYNSLGAFETGTATSFRRTLAPDERRTHGIAFAAYLGDVWRASPRLQLTYGLRLEGSAFRNAPAFNPALDSVFARRTDRLPSEVALSPRAGFTWTLGGARLGGRPDWIVRGGAGAFRSPVPTGLVGLAHLSTGLPTSEAQITCIGAAVPAADWPGFGVDGATIPTACAGAPAATGARRPDATVFSASYGAPRAWRTSLGVQRFVTALLRVSADITYARGTHQYGFSDLNLDTTGGFALAAEGDRRVFVDPSRIVPATGAVRFGNSRRDRRFGQVLEIGSDLASETKQLTIGVGGVTRGGIVLQTSYTWSHVRDQASATVRLGSAGFGSSTTSGNPNTHEWARSNFERRHQFLATVSYPFGIALELTGIARLTSGIPYTPIVATDINGDGARNDRAFVFDPNGTDGTSAGMSRLLAATSTGARTCLREQVGRIAGRNSCTGPWQASFDLQLNYRPTLLGLSRRLSVSVVTVNLLRGIDDLLHGDEPRGWGQRTRPDATLLFVEGFDPVTQRFTYAVNERFGATRTGAQAVRTPFQVGIQVRFSFGPNRGRDAMDRLRGGRGRGGRFGGRGGGAGVRALGGLGGGTPEDFVERFRSLFPNPAALVFEMRDSLRLGEEQVAAVAAARDSLAARTDSLAADLQREITEYGNNRDPRGLVALIRPSTQVARTNMARTIRRLREILTANQWALLPDGLRNAGNRQRRPQRRNQ